MKSPDFLLIDLFCGAGGTTTGAELSGVCKVIAAVNHDPLAIATATAQGAPRWTPADTDSPAMTELKNFMRANGIADIFMRMLKVVELKRIQGFPDNYVLCGPIEQQKKFIGNSVETGIVAAWLRAISAATPSPKTAPPSPPHTAPAQTAPKAAPHAPASAPAAARAG